ncbi:tenascin X-like protein [Mitosporidium daphniae]|uniref:Tenascin X-like protein n=1 Tax=Mitosporidium daphniae TaxID=1485682 RepID=A0A098VUX9_9MICR|nr:tenascin X-like protein [Mitosporidium daphniae]KGG52684.1 tenascin X-like protein [Mitosporidium daphniae]|eukprot:XP_013239120.1 tenascin X-like protein [Mitosporidium daphniae]
MWVSIKYFLASILILPCLLNGEYIYLHPKFTSSIRADPVSKYYPLISKSQELHPRLYQILNLPASHESNFYRLDGNGNPIINTDTSIASSSEIGQLEIPASMLSAYESPTVLANLFIKTHRVSVCGDGILDFGNDEKCEFVLTEMGKNSFVATTPPPNYHFQWVQDKKSIHPTQRECLWAPGRIGGCNNRASLGGIQRFHLPSPIFAHYCGDGIHDISPTHPLLQSLLEAWNQPTSEYRQFFTICGYLDEHCLLPIYCNEGSNPWIVTGKTIRFTSNSLEQCDLGDLLNGAASSGCTSECSLRCSHKHGGVVDWNDWPRLSCHQPCPDARWKGLYCDVPNCDHGIPNLHEGGCYSCENGWIGPSCSQNICGNGRIAGWDDSVAKTQRKPICICNAGWYGPACDKSYCALWDSGGKCLECISGKRDPTTYCIQDACVYGEKPPRASADGSCLQPCKVGFFSGKFCNETKCIQWERIDLTSINDIRCVKCLPGHELPNCTPSQNSNVYSRCENPWKFGYDCSQSRRKNPSTNQCIPGWIGKYCSILACTRGYPDFSHPKLHCIKGSCLPGWGGKWCEISNLILIDDLNKHQNWAKARALVYKKYVYLTQNSPLGVSLKLWRDIATAIVYGKRPTDLMAKNSINRLPDWKNLDKAIDHERVYFSEKSSWIPLKPDQQINHAIDNVKLEMGKFLQRLKSKNLYVGISSKDPNFDYDIPIQKHCEYGIPQEASKYLPCRDCAPGWFGDYCDMTNCVEFLKDNTNCTNCKPGYEGDFCLIETLKKDKNVECSNGWENPNCQMPKCLYGYRLVSPQYSRQKKLHQAVSAQNPITIDIMHLFRIERKWIKKHIPCELSASQMTTTSYDIKMHSIVKTVTNSLLCDGILIRSVEDSRCSACYPGFGGDYCTTMSNGKPIDNCTEICINGVWNWEKGYCFPCFAGFFGESCEKSHCMELSTSNYTCISCQMLNPSELDLKLRDLLKTHASPLYGQRFGDYCESRGLCLFGVQSKTDEGCLSCSSPCVTGPYCNETRCSYFSSDQIPICAVCKEGWKGVCCQESAILEEKKAVPSILDSIFNTCKSIGLVGWPQCSRNRCTYGAMNLTDR